MQNIPLAQRAIGDAVTDLGRSALLFVPKAVGFVAIIVIGYLVAKAIRRIVGRTLGRVGFDRAVERSGLQRVLHRTAYDPSEVCARLAYYGVLLLTLQLGFGLWGPNPISDLINGVIAWLPRAVVSILIVVVAAAIGSAVRDLVRGALGGLAYGGLLATVCSAFILGLGVIAALNQVGIATTVTTPVLVAMLATISGILIVGVGGGLVRPMQQRWESWLDRAAAESRLIRERAEAYAAGDDHHEMAGHSQPAGPPSREATAAQPPIADPTVAQPPLAHPPSVQPPSVEPPLGQPAFAQPAFGQPPTPEPADAWSRHGRVADGGGAATRTYHCGNSGASAAEGDEDAATWSLDDTQRLELEQLRGR